MINIFIILLNIDNYSYTFLTIRSQIAYPFFVQNSFYDLNQSCKSPVT